MRFEQPLQGKAAVHEMLHRRRSLSFYSLVSQGAPMLSHKLLTEAVVQAGTGPALISRAERSRDRNASSVISSILDRQARVYVLICTIRQG